MMKLVISFDEIHEIGNTIKLMPMSKEGYYYLADKIFYNEGWDNMYDLTEHQIIEIDSVKYVSIDLERK